MFCQESAGEIMIGFLFTMFLVVFLLSIGFRLTGALLGAIFWLAIQIPLAIVAMAIGLAFCCTILLIPIGIVCLKAGFKLLIPGI